MENYKADLQPILRTLVSGRDSGPAVDRYVSGQLYKVACTILSGANKTDSADGQIDANLSYRNRYPDETDILMKLLETTVSKRLGKMLEIPLFGTIARLHQVPDAHYQMLANPEKPEEAAICFVNRQGVKLTCEFQFSNTVDSECADAAFSHDSTIVFVDTRTESLQRELHRQSKHWVELGAIDGYKRTYTVFTYLDIPCVDFDGDLDAALDEIIPQVFEEIA